MTHELKILPKYYQAVWDGRKNFEIRFDDRGYRVGDRLILKEWNRGKFTGRSVTVKVKYVYRGDGTYGIPENIVVMALEWLEAEV